MRSLCAMTMILIVVLLPGCSVTDIHGHYQTTKAKIFLLAMRPGNYFEEEQLALVKAARRCDESKLSELVAEGADLDGMGVDGMTPLTWMVVKHNYRGLTCLLEAGATPDYQAEIEYYGQRTYVTALEYAVAMRDTRYMKALLESGADPALSINPVSGTPVVYSAILAGRVENIEILIDHGFDINHVSKFGSTAITRAARMNKFQIALWLYEHGADPSLTDETAPSPSSALDSIKRYGAAGVNRWSKDVGAYHELVNRLVEDGYLDEAPPSRL